MFEFYHKLDDSQKYNVRKFFHFTEKLRLFSNYATPKVFKYIYGERGDHMADLFFIKARRDMVAFLNLVDDDARALLIAHVEYDENLKSNLR